MSDGPSLAALEAELAELRRRRELRQRQERDLGWGARNVEFGTDIAAEALREERAAEHAWVTELEVLIAERRAELPQNRNQRLSDFHQTWLDRRR
jgi:hypothetical protein